MLLSYCQHRHTTANLHIQRTHQWFCSSVLHKCHALSLHQRWIFLPATKVRTSSWSRCLWQPKKRRCRSSFPLRWAVNSWPPKKSKSIEICPDIWSVSETIHWRVNLAVFHSHIIVTDCDNRHKRTSHCRVSQYPKHMIYIFVHPIVWSPVCTQRKQIRESRKSRKWKDPVSNFQGVILIADPKCDPGGSLCGASASGALCTGSGRSLGFIRNFEEFMGAREVVVGPTPHEVHQNHLAKRNETWPKPWKRLVSVEYAKASLTRCKNWFTTLRESEDLRLP